MSLSRQNYFQVFDLKPSYNLDLAQLETRYLQLARKYHPDHNPKYFQEMIYLNQAYQVLNHWEKRIEYLLKLWEIREVPPHPEFLEKVWDLRDSGDSEALQEFRAQIRSQLEDALQKSDSGVIQKLFTQYRFLGA